MSKGVISWPVKHFPKFSILDKLLVSGKHPKLGIQLPNARDNNQSCCLLTVVFNQINQLRVL